MGSRWPSWLNECQYQLEAPHSGVLAKRSPRRGVRSLPCIITRITSSHTADTPQPRTSRGQRSYKDKRCRQRSRKYETRGVAEERLARIWPGPTAVIARHHHGTGQLPEACCSSSVVSGRKWNIAGIIIKTSFLWNLRGIQTQMEYMNRVLCLKKKKTCSEMNISWYHQPQVHRYCITKESRLSGSQQSVMAVPVKWPWINTINIEKC